MPSFWKRCCACLLIAITSAIFTTSCCYAQQHNDIAALMKQLTALAQAGRYGDAIPLARTLVSEAERMSGPESLVTAQALVILGQTLQAQGQFVEAEAAFKKALAIRERTLGGDHPDVAAPLSNLAQIALTRNQLPAAEQYVLRAIAIQERAQGGNDLNTAMTRMVLGNLRHRQLRDAEALEIFGRALETFKGLPGAEIMAAVALNNIAEVNKEEGRLSSAEDSYREALAIQEKLYGADSLYVAPMLNNLGDLHRLRGRLSEAESLARRTLEIREKALGPDHPDVAASLSNLAIVFSKEGRAPEAEGLLIRALAIQEKALGPDHPDVATALNNLADAIITQGRRQEAESLLRRSLAIREKSLGAEHPLVAITLDNLVAVMAEDNRWEEAEPLARRSLAIRENAFSRDHPLVAASLNNLALVLSNTGRTREAEPLLQEALAIRSNGLGEVHPDVATSLSNLAFHYLDMQDWRVAYDTFSRATAIWTARGAEVEIRDNANPFRGTLTAAYRLAEVDQPSAAKLRDAAFETAQWIGDDQAARAISRMSARIAAGSGELPVLVRERQDLGEQALAVDHALIATASEAKQDRNLEAEAALRNKAQAIASRLEELDKKIGTQFPEYTTLITRSPVPASSVQGLLAPNEALMMFTPTRDATFVWTITQSQVRWHAAPLGDKLLAEQVRILRCGLDLTAWTGASATECETKLRTASASAPQDSLPFDVVRAHELYEALFGPVEKTIEGKELILVPSGALATLPFNVLITEKPGSDNEVNYRRAPWLVKRFATTVLPSIASLKALRQFAKKSGAQLPYIGFGNPLLDGDKSDAADLERARQARAFQHCSSASVAALDIERSRKLEARGIVVARTGGGTDITQLKGLPPLPETAEELCAVAKDFTPAGEVHLGAEATEARIKSLSESGQLAKYRVIHFATHGALSGEVRGPVEPGLILTPPGTATTLDDGYLSASEISGLKLDADWVVLSACNTAGAESDGAEAFSGLARAFFYAGTRAMLVSHWAVESDATVALVTGTIASLRADPKIGRAEALRRSMIALIEHGPTGAARPAAWAPFVVVGEGSVRSQY